MKLYNALVVLRVVFCILAFMQLKFIYQLAVPDDEVSVYTPTDFIILSQPFVRNRGAGNGFACLIMSMIISRHTKRCSLSKLPLIL